MKNFTYAGYDSSGSKVAGEIDADGIEQASTALQRRGIMISRIKESAVLPESMELFTRRNISADELELLTSELSLLLNSGVTIDRGLGVIRRNTGSRPYAKLVGNLYDAIRSGSSLSESMEGQNDTFSPLYINLVKLGESSGTLPKIFARLAEDIKFQGQLKRKIIQALTYPAVIFLVCIL